MKKLKVLCIALLAIAGCVHKTDDIVGNGTQTGNAFVRGILYTAANKPARNAKVRFITVDHNPSGLPKAYTVVDSTTTNDSGVYTLDTLAAGTYNVFGTDSGLVSYLDSLLVDSDTVVVPPDTVKQPGSLAGVIKMQPGDDPKTVLIIMFGTTVSLQVSDGQGRFNLPNLAEGNYPVRFLSTIDVYAVFDTVFHITAGTADTLANTLAMPLKIPIPKNFRLSYDTLKQIVTLAWDPIDTAVLQGVNVYRRNVDSSAQVKLNNLPVKDTVFRDSTGVQNETYEYQVAGVDKTGKDGNRSVADSVSVVSAFKFAMTFGSAGSGDGQFNEPGEMAVDSLGNIYALDPFNNTQGKIHKFSSGGVFIKTWVAGAFDELRDIEIIRDTLYVLDRKNKKIKVFNTIGDSLGVWTFSAATDPLSITLYDKYALILDKQNNRILKYSLAGDSLSTWTGIGGNNFKALKTITTGLGLDKFYVLDSDSLGYVVDSAGILISQFKIDRMAIVSAYTQWFLLKSGALAYAGSDIPTVFVIDTAGHMLAQFGEFGTGNGQFKYPTSVIEYSNKIFVSDAQNSRIQVFDE